MTQLDLFGEPRKGDKFGHLFDVEVDGRVWRAMYLKIKMRLKAQADADRLASEMKRIAVQWIGDEIDKEQTGDEPDYQSAYEGVVGIARAALAAHEGLGGTV